MELNEPAGLPDGTMAGYRAGLAPMRPGHYIKRAPFHKYHAPFSEKGARKGEGSYSYIGVHRNFLDILSSKIQTKSAKYSR